MRKIVVREFGGPEVLVAEESAVPEPGPGEVRIRVHAAGVNPADTYIRSGGYAFFTPELPYTPGFDGAGVVEAVGSAPGWAVAEGDRVFVAALGLPSTGTYAEHVVCAAGAVHPLPDGVGFREGAALGVPWTTAYHALFQRGKLIAGETVLVHGASGGVGLPAVRMAVRAGATVIGTAGTDAGRALVSSAGAAHVLDHHRAGYLDAVGDLTGGRGADLVVEMLADRNLDADLAHLAVRGRVVVVGSRGTAVFTPRLLMQRQADLLGTALWNLTDTEKLAALTAIRELIGSGCVPPPVETVFALGDAALAHERILSSPALGKCVLDCG